VHTASTVCPLRCHCHCHYRCYYFQVQDGCRESWTRACSRQSCAYPPLYSSVRTVKAPQAWTVSARTRDVSDTDGYPHECPTYLFALFANHVLPTANCQRYRANSRANSSGKGTSFGLCLAPTPFASSSFAATTVRSSLAFAQSLPHPRVKYKYTGIHTHIHLHTYLHTYTNVRSYRPLRLGRQSSPLPCLPRLPCTVLTHSALLAPAPARIGSRRP
jgi:hypothetical protein